MDADDWLSNDAIEVQSSHMRSDKLDLLIFDPYVCTKKTKYVDRLPHFLKDKVVCSKNIAPVALREAAGAAWRCCYRTDFIRQNNILFPEGIKLSEDCIFNLIALGKAKRIKYIDNCLYFYFINEDGAVKSYHYDYPEIVYDAHQIICECILELWGEEYLDVFGKTFLSNCFKAFDAICQAKQDSIKKKKHRLEKFCQRENVKTAFKKYEINNIRAFMVKRQYYWLLLFITLIKLKIR